MDGDKKRLDEAFADVRSFIDVACGYGDFGDALDQAGAMFRQALNSDEHDEDVVLSAIYAVAEGVYIVSGASSREAAIAMAACAMMRVAITRKKKPRPVSSEGVSSDG